MVINIPCEHLEIILLEEYPKDCFYSSRMDKDKIYYFANCIRCGTTLFRDFEDYHETHKKHKNFFVVYKRI
jgi:hypothetical protein